MKTILKMAILPALLLALASVANAVPYTFQLGSYGSAGLDSVTPISGANINQALVYGGYNPISGAFNASYLIAHTPPTAYSIQGNSAWAAPIPGSQWVSYADSGSGNVVPPNGYYKYTSTFSIDSTQAGKYDGLFNVLADDTLAVWIDGLLIVDYASGGNSTCQTNEPNCRVVDAISINNLALFAGLHTITVIDAQTNGSAAGVDFESNLTETPEPSSLLLLGTGLLGLALVVFRKARPSHSMNLSM